MAKSLTKDDVIRRLQEFIARHENRKKAAAALGVSAQFMYDVLSGSRAPGRKILLVLGLEQVKLYQPVARAST